MWWYAKGVEAMAVMERMAARLTNIFASRIKGRGYRSPATPSRRERYFYLGKNLFT